MLAQISNLYLLTRRTPQTPIKWCEHAILWEFEVFEDCGNCIAMEQSGYISEWQNLLLTEAWMFFTTFLFIHLRLSSAMAEMPVSYLAPFQNLLKNQVPPAIPMLQLW